MYLIIVYFEILYVRIIFNLEPYPHAPKLNDPLSGNDIMIHRVLNPSPNARVKLITDYIRP